MRHQRAFTLLEVIIALTIMGIGLIGLIQLFPMGLRVSANAENQTRAAILAQEILESLKTDPYDLPFVQELDPTLKYGIPGNGFDDDGRLIEVEKGSNGDRNLNGFLDIDFDGGYVDKDRNGEPDPFDNEDNPYNLIGLFIVDRRLDSVPYKGDLDKDGDPYYDPENYLGYGIDEEWPDGKDDRHDLDGQIDEDCRLASNRVYYGRGGMDPLAPGDGIDNDGDGEPDPEGRAVRKVRQYWYPPDPKSDDNPFIEPPEERSIADGDDNNGDGKVDEGIDEELFDGIDNDGDGRIDEDCRLAVYPFQPRRFAAPNDTFFWQVFVGRVSDGGGDGLDNDGDGRIDEDPRDGIDNDLDGWIDEDPSPMPVPGYRRVVVRIMWGGNNEDEDGDGFDLDEDGIPDQGVDEELRNGLDDDLDGRVDEDCFEYFYELTGYIRLKGTQS